MRHRFMTFFQRAAYIIAPTSLHSGDCHCPFTWQPHTADFTACWSHSLFAHLTSIYKFAQDVQVSKAHHHTLNIFKFLFFIQETLHTLVIHCALSLPLDCFHINTTTSWPFLTTCGSEQRFINTKSPRIELPMLPVKQMHTYLGQPSQKHIIYSIESWLKTDLELSFLCKYYQ